LTKDKTQTNQKFFDNCKVMTTGTLLAISVLISLTLALHVNHPTLEVQSAQYTSDRYACSCADPNAKTIYLFNQIFNDQEGKKQFSAQVTYNQTLFTNVTIADMGIYKFDQFHATACVVSKNILYVIGQKLSDEMNGANKTNTIVKWNLDTYELQQYNQLDPSLDKEYFHDMAVDHDMRLLFAISSSKLQQLDMNCLDLLDTVHLFPFFEEDAKYIPFLSSVTVNPAVRKVFIGMQHTVLMNAPPGALYSIEYERETLSKDIKSLRVGNHLQVSTVEISTSLNVLFAGVFYTTGNIIPDNSSILTIAAGKEPLQVLSTYINLPIDDGRLPFALRYSQKNSKLYSITMKSLHQGVNFVCQYNVGNAGKLLFGSCIDIFMGTKLHLNADESGLLYPYVGYASNNGDLSYRLASVTEIK
jgi:hypothetical protein